MQRSRSSIRRVVVAAISVVAMAATSLAIEQAAAAASPAPSGSSGSAANLTPGTSGMAMRTDSTGAVRKAAARTSGASNQQSPAPNPADDLIQGSGPVMTSPVIYNVFWLPPGQHYESDSLASSDTRYENLLNRFAGDVGGNPFYNIVTQYPGSNGTPNNGVSFGGSWVDTGAYPHAGTQTDPLLDADIQAEATNAATTKGWTKDVNHIYLVYTAFNVFECQTSTSDCNFFKTGHTNAYCAYHFAFGGSPTVYSFMGDDSMFGDPGGCSNGVAPNVDAAADAEISTASHEFIESVTDPQINNWLSSVATGQQEIGDLCNRNDGPHNLAAPGADVYLGGHPYDIQQEWSNAVHACAMDLNVVKNSDVPPTLTLSKTGPTTAVTGQAINYTVTVTNPSDTDASTLTRITDTLPAGVTYVPGSASISPSSTSPLTWSLGTLAVHDSVTITFQATSTPASISNCAAVNYDDMLQIAAQSAVTSCAPTTVSQAATTTVLSSSANPSVFGQPVTLTATVAPVAPGSGTPTGTASFFDGATLLGSAALSSGVATLTTSSLSVGTHSITAVYSGDGNFIGSTSSVLSQVVNKAPTITTLTANPSGSVGFGHHVTFTAAVSVPPPGVGTPTGTMTFFVDATPVGTVPLSGLQAGISTSALTPGSHLIQATYNGDGNFLSSTGILNYLVTCTTTITGTHSGPVIASGDSVCIVNATVTGSVTVPTGTSLAVVNSTIDGSISATSSPNAITVCGSHFVGGSVNVIKAGGLVVVGDPGDANCPVNVITATLLLENNTHGVEAINNTVGGLVAFGNSGPGPYPGDGTVISGNHH